MLKSNLKVAPTSTRASRKGLQAQLPSIHKENTFQIMNPNHNQRCPEPLFKPTLLPLNLPVPSEFMATSRLRSPMQRRSVLRPWGSRNLEPSLAGTGHLRVSSLIGSKEFESGGSTFRQSGTLHLGKTNSMRDRSSSLRQRGGCLIAVRKGPFPMTQKQYQQTKLVQFFEIDDRLSTIDKREEGEHPQTFISLGSFTQLVF